MWKARWCPHDPAKERNVICETSAEEAGGLGRGWPGSGWRDKAEICDVWREEGGAERDREAERPAGR